MTDYVKIRDYATKDLLPSGNPSKIIKGSELDTEFTAIAAADLSNIKTEDLSDDMNSFLLNPSAGTFIDLVGFAGVYSPHAAVVIDVDNTTVVPTPYYTMGAGLKVLLNGLLQRTGYAYQETSSQSITFSEGLYVGDLVVFTVNVAGFSTPILRLSPQSSVVLAEPSYIVTVPAYTQGTGMEVFLNGLRQQITVAYAEASTTSIQFSELLSVNDVVMVYVPI